MPSFGAAFLRYKGKTPGPPISRNFTREGAAVSCGSSPGIEAPLGPHTFARRSEEAGRGCSPSGAGLRAAAHPQGGRLWRTRRRQAAFGGDAGGNLRARTGKRPGCRGKNGRLCRETAHSGRVSGGIRGAAPGRNRETGRRQCCVGGVWQGFRGAKRGQRGGKGGISGLKAEKRAGKALHTAGFGRKTGRSTAFYGRRVTGSRSLLTARVLTRVQARFARI